MTSLFSRDLIARWFFLIPSAVIIFLFYHILAPFAMVLVSAGILAILVSPIDNFLRRHLPHPKLRAACITLLAVLLLALPLAFGSVVAVQQGFSLAAKLTAYPDALSLQYVVQMPWFLVLPETVRSWLASFDVSQVLLSLLQWVAENGANIFKSGADLVFKTVIFFICFYFFILDRDKLKEEVRALSPLKDSIDQEIATRMIETVRSVVFGSLVVACVQGVVAAIGLTLFGVPGALLWALLVVIAAQIPMFGTASIMLPAVVYLFLSGHVAAAAGLLLWSLLAVGLIDNVLQPVIVGQKTRMHALLILLSMLGGISYFGAMGFILGPTVLAGFLVILELYKVGLLERSTLARTPRKK